MRSLGEVMAVASLEGALLDKNGQMPQANVDVIQLFCSREGRFTVASNRTPAYVSRMLQGIPVTDPVICCGGATIYDVKNQEYIAQRVLNTQQATDLLASVLIAFPQVGAIIQRQDGVLCVVQANEHTHAYLEREQTNWLLSQIEDVQQPWVRMILVGTADVMDRLEPYAERHRSNKELSFMRASEESFHILGMGVSKGNALRELSALCEMPQPYMYSIGGDHNDQSLLQATGHGIALPEAPVRVKLAADLVTRLNRDEGGAAEFLYQLVKEFEA